MKTTIETINGKNYTVIRRAFDAEWVREQLDCRNFVNVVLRDMKKEFERDIINPTAQNLQNWGRFTYTEAILPALPRHPKPEDARLLYRYMSESLTVYAETVSEELPLKNGEICSWLNNPHCDSCRITLVRDSDGNRVEIAILEDTHAE